MIPTIATICEDLAAGKITVQQAMAWLQMHVEGTANELRDAFAIAAMQGMITKSSGQDTTGGKKGVPLVAKYAYEYADAMLEARTT
jgi:hypothetical protein